VLVGQGGRDRLDGGAGIDTADWGAAAVDLDIDLAGEALRFKGESRIYEAVIAVENAVAGGGDDILRGTAGDNVLDGGGGADLAVYAGLRTAYTLAEQPDGSWELAGPDGTDTLVAIEQVQFADALIDL
jgi:Ca2+-binding RTX toxin-like protein